MKNKILKNIFFILLALFCFNFTSGSAKDTDHELVIIKYGLNSKKQTAPQKQVTESSVKINNLPMDNPTADLSLLSGIHYQLQPIEASNQSVKISLADDSSYIKVGKSTDLITDDQGEASVQLTDGFYILTEEINAAEHLYSPAQPLLIEITQQTENPFFIYPRSSIDPEENTPKQVSKSAQSKTGKNPNLISNLSLFLFAGFGIAFLIIGIWLSHINVSEEKEVI